MSTIGTATRSTGAKTTRPALERALMPRMAAEAGCAAMAGTAAAIAAGTAPAETGATCVFGGERGGAGQRRGGEEERAGHFFVFWSLRGQCVVHAGRRPRLRNDASLSPGSRTEKFQPRCKRVIYMSRGESHSAALQRLYLSVGRQIPGPDAA